MRKRLHGLSEVEQRIANQFPHALSPTLAQFRSLYHDKHSAFFGELVRWRNLLGFLDAKRQDFELMGNPPERVSDLLRKTLHGRYVGELEDLGRRTLPMYRGTAADFEHDLIHWREACKTVEDMYDFIRKFLPPGKMKLNGLSRDLKVITLRDERVRRTDDPLELIAQARPKAAFVSRVERRRSHEARLKLALAQFNFESARDGYAAATLEDMSVKLERFIIRNLFDGHAPDSVHIEAELDPSNGYRCRDWKIVETGEPFAEARDDLFVAAVKRYHMRCGDKRIPVFFEVRPKRHLALKALIKEIRFLQLMGMGDSVAMMFIVDGEHLDEIVTYIRPIIVPCPGSVAFQGSSIGYRNGRQLDLLNTRSSPDYEAMKFECRTDDRVVEVQFVPTKPWINSRSAHNRANHNWYKLKGLLEEVFPILYPKHLYGIPWQSGALREACIRHVLKFTSTIQ